MEKINYEALKKYLSDVPFVKNIYDYKKNEYKTIKKKIMNIEGKVLEEYKHYFFNCLENIEKQLQITSFNNMIYAKNYENYYEYILNLKKEIKDGNRIILSIESEKEKYDFFDCYTMLLMWNLNTTIETTIDESEFSEMLEHPLNDGNELDRTIFFRGQNKFEYDLIPSFYRSLDNDIIVDNKYIENKYKFCKLYDKYQNLFNSSSFNYLFYSYMQHSVSYSPFIDFTRSLGIATSFALEIDNPDLFNTQDRGVYELNILNNDIIVDTCNPSFNIDFHNGKLRMTSLIFGKPLFLAKISDFSCTISIHKDITNDRMRVQKGLFFCLNKGVIANNRILMFSNDLYLHKYRIIGSSASAIYKTLVAFKPQYDYNYLMDPYLYIRDFKK